MASSSMSQESLDRDDPLYMNSADFHARRSRIRCMRAKGTLYKTDREVTDSTLQENDVNTQEVSPNRLGANRGKEKRSRPNHMYSKGKLAKDKRKLREKRRSTGVVHLPSTESTGDSLDENGEDDSKSRETQVNTEYNNKSVGDVKQLINKLSMNANYQSSSSNCTTSKSPSDVDADLEDNQDDTRIQSDSTSLPQADVITKIQKQSSLELNFNGYRAPTTKPTVPISSTRDTKATGSRVQSLAASFGNRADSDSPAKSTYSPIGYTSPRRNFDPSRWLPKTTHSAPSDHSGVVSPVIRETDSVGLAHTPLSARDSTDTSSRCRVPSLTESRPTNVLSPARRLNHVSPVEYAQSSVSKDEPKLELIKLREENDGLLHQLEEKDAKILELEKRIAEIEKESSNLTDAKADLEEQNSTLLRAIIKLTAQ